MTRALFTGDRNWKDSYIVDVVIGGLESLLNGFPKEELVIMEGEARGLDRIARNVAELRHRVTSVLPFPVDTSVDGPWPAAGVHRNARMLDEGKPHLTFSFHNDLPRSRGTLDMIERSLQAGLSTYHISQVSLERVQTIRRWQREMKKKGLL